MDQNKQTPRRAVVVGGGVAGLVAAKELRAAGLSVDVYEGAAVWGGCVGVHSVAGVTLDSGAESFATRSTAVADLLGELGLAADIVAPDPSGAWVWLPDGPVPLPRTGVLGIPADLHAPEVKEALGTAGVLRAALDANLPAHIGTSEAVSSVADLVRARMGRRVLERLVAPVVAGVHSADPEVLDVDMVAPGLRAGIREHGSLAAAVAAQRAAGTKPGSAVAGLAGGMHRMVTALVAQLLRDGVHLHAGHPVERLGRTEAGQWEVHWRRTDPAAAKAPAKASAKAPAAPEAGTGSTLADVLVLATEGPAAVRLLAPEVPALVPFAPAPGPDVRLVTLVLDVPELDDKPCGTGILVAPQTPGIKAKALTHATAKWDWLAATTGPGTHVLRLSYGRAGVSAADAVRLTARTIDDAELIRWALADATTLLGQPLAEADVLGADVVRWRGALPFAAVGHRAKIGLIQGIARQQPGLALVGGWVSGNGLAAVVAGTRTQLRELLAAEAPA